MKVAGWVENIRDHGGVSFVDLRDMYGVLQVVMRDTSLLDGLSREMCISIEGLVEKRDEETYNPRIPTGTIKLLKSGRQNFLADPENILLRCETHLKIQLIEFSR